MAEQYIPINKEQIPYQFELRLGAELFSFVIKYNDDYDFFTIDLLKDGEVLVYGERIVYDVPLFTDVEDFRFPIKLVTPTDVSKQESRVTYENLGETVFLVVET